jgi:hypothetical protein
MQAAALDLPYEPAYRPSVEAHLAVAFRMAPLFLDFKLADEAEPAPIYRAEDEA